MRPSRFAEAAVETLAYEARSFITTQSAGLAESAGLTGIYRGLNGIEGQSSAWRVGDQAGKLKHTLPLNRNRDCSLGGDSANRGYHLGIAVRQGRNRYVELIKARLYKAGIDNRRCDAPNRYLN